MNNIVAKPIAPVPRALNDWVRKIKEKRTINDMVEDAHLALFASDPEYPPLLDAVYDEQAVEGSLSADNIVASQKIREWGKDGGLAKEKLATISKALNVVLRRYEFSRKERRFTVHGLVVQPENGGGE